MWSDALYFKEEHATPVEVFVRGGGGGGDEFTT